MRLITVICLWLTILTPSLGRSQDSLPAVAPIGFCQSISQAKKQELKFSKRLKILGEFLLMRYFPTAYAKPVIKVVENNNLLHGSEIISLKRKNLIFSIGPDPQAMNDFKLDEKQQEHYQSVEKEIAQMQKVLKLMFKAKTLEKCTRVARQNAFSQTLYVQLLNEKTLMPWPRQQNEMEMLEKKLIPFIKKSKMTWQYIAHTRIEDVVNALVSPQTENVIIIGHGKKNGQLIDSTLATYPIGAFEQISPRIKSLAFYSCYSDKTLNYYSLEQLFSNSQSLAQKRYLVSVKDRQSDFAGQVAPLQGIKSFLKNWERYLVKNRTNVSDSFIPEPSCQMQLSNYKLKTGTLSVALNRKLIAIIRPFQDVSTRDFPCSFLKQDRNVIVIKNESTASSATGDFSQFNLKINNGESWTDGQFFYNPDASLRSIIFSFK